MVDSDYEFVKRTILKIAGPRTDELDLSSIFTRSSTLFVMRVSGAGIGFLTQVLLAKLLGAHDLGLFYSATSLAAVAGYVTSQGYSLIVFRFAARYRDANKARLFEAFVGRAVFDGLATALAAATIVIALSLLVPEIDDKTRIAYAVGGGLIVANACLNIYTNLAGAIRLFGWCYVPEGTGRPFAFLAIVLAIAAVVPLPTTSHVMIAYGALTGAIAILVVLALRPHLPRLVRPSRATRRLGERWRAEARPLVLLTLYTNSFADIAILFATPFLAPADLAVLGLSIKLSLLVGYFVQITQQMAVPDLADARQKQDHDGMRRAIRRSILLPLAMTVAATLVCAVFGNEILALFGTQFVHGREVLVILIASQLLRAMAGPSAHLLTLSGAQRLNASLSVGALLLLFAGCAALAPAFGPEGAAVAVTFSYAAWLGATALALAHLGEVRTDLLTILRLAPAARPTPAE